MKINFKRFRKYTKVDKSAFVEVDVREMFADNIYNVTGAGIADLKLAEKIFSSNEDTEFTEQEAARINDHARQLLPWFIAGLEFAVEGNK